MAVAKLIRYSEQKEYGKKVLYGSFSYRDHEYMVRYGGWNAASDDEPWMQHRNEQKRIDKEIEQAERKTTKETKYEDTVEYAMELFMQDFD